MLLVTLLTSGLLGLLFFLLGLRVVQKRLAGTVAFGDGGDQALMERVRAHGNFAEHVPFLLVLIAGIEASIGHGSVWLWASGGILVVARIVHAIGISRPSPNMFRSAGVVLTWLLLVGLSLWALGLGFGLLSPASPQEYV